MTHLIDNDDGTPLPDKLQFESPLWEACFSLALEQGVGVEAAMTRSNNAMRVLAPVLYPDDDGRT